MGAHRNRIVVLLTTIVCSTTLMAQYWDESMYGRYTYSNYTNYSAFTQVIDPADFDARLLNAAVFYETSLQRVIHGGKSYQYDHNLEACAQNHTYDMITRHFFSHTSIVQGKEKLRDRMLQAGCEYRAAAENIAYCSLNSAWTYVDCAKHLVNGWMNSPGHRENILNSIYVYLGCGTGLYYQDGYILVKAAQNFLLKE